MKYFKLSILLLSMLIVFNSCEEKEILVNKTTGTNSGVDSIVNKLLQGYVENNLGAISPVTYQGIYFLEESTDELIVPTRVGYNWWDGGLNIQLQTHSWDANNTHILKAWNYCFHIVNGCNEELKKDGLSVRSIAELRLLRAYAYYRLLDLFGNVPVITETTAFNPANSSRQVVYNFINSELNNPIMENLNLKDHLMNRGVLNTLKARLYLNAEVFIGESAWQDCIDACDEVISSSQYTLENNVFANFYIDNEYSKENILAISYDASVNQSLNCLQMNFLPDEAGIAWNIDIYKYCINGPCVNPGKTENDPEATYNLFQPNDIRRLSMLDQPLKDPVNGNVLFTFTPYFTGGINITHLSPTSLLAKEQDGVRMIKYEISSTQQNWDVPNDWVLMRYTEVLYMKAECLIRLGRSSEARSIFEQVLSTRGFDNSIEITPAICMSKRRVLTQSLTNIIPSTLDLDFMEKELRREFIFEDHRRTDMIRFGKFLGTWGLKETISADYRKLFSIPSVALSSNPNLVQNPGY